MSWQTYFPETNKKILYHPNHISIRTEGTYFVYLNLRVSQHATNVNINKSQDFTLLSSSPTFATDTDGEYYGTVQVSQLVKISSGTKLFVQVVFNDSSAKVKMLFPNAKNPKRRSEDNFGAFLVS